MFVSRAVRTLEFKVTRDELDVILLLFTKLGQ